MPPPPLSRADRARQEWLCERAEAELEDCPDCSVPAGTTCTHPDGHPLVRAPAHPNRIKTRAAHARSNPAEPG